jgi:hypothetical protein
VSVVFTEADQKLGLTFPVGLTPLCVDAVNPTTQRAHPELRRGEPAVSILDSVHID